MKRNFAAPPDDSRCAWTIRLRGPGLGADDFARCMRRATAGNLCAQHAKMAAAFSCEYCGGNDELPPDHCADCTAPTVSARSRST